MNEGMTLREPLRVLTISSYPPNPCGVAVHAYEILSALSADASDGLAVDARVIALDSSRAPRDYPNEVVAVHQRDDLAGLRRLAAYINHYGADVVDLQHEFGLWGGFEGRFVLDLLDRLRVPVVATFHTVPVVPSPFGFTHRRAILGEIARRVRHAITMIPAAADVLVEVCGSDPARTSVIPPGVPPIVPRTPAERAAQKAALGLDGHTVISTFGLLSRFKGLDDILAAMPAVLGAHPDALLLVIGRMHPHEPADYLARLQEQIADAGLADRIRFISSFVDTETLTRYLTASDIYVSASRDPAQISSGTLLRAMQAGLPVVSTAHPFARWALAEGRGVLVPFQASDALAQALEQLLAAPGERAAMAQRAQGWSTGLEWPRVAAAYLERFQRAATG